jgi:copper chaperone
MATIKITGMRCGHCTGAVTKALENIEGIADVRVDLDKGEATYTETRPVPPAVIKEAISKIGFEVAG